MKVHHRLEAVLRAWAKDCKAAGEEVVFEAAVEDREPLINLLSSQLAALSRVWLLLRAGESGGCEFIPNSDLVSILAEAFDCCQMISLVNPSTGGGVTIDVSDEGDRHLILQIAGWGDCIEFTNSASKHFRKVYWIGRDPSTSADLK